MATEFERKYEELLENIEANIISTSRRHPKLVDYNVNKVLTAMIRTIEADQKNKKPPRLSLNEGEEEMYDLLYVIYALTTDHESVAEIQFDGKRPNLGKYTPDEVIACFKRLQKSIRTFSDQGRRGYLNIVGQFFSNGQ